jgi:hypothetical protein
MLRNGFWDARDLSRRVATVADQWLSRQQETGKANKKELDRGITKNAR